MNSSLDIIAPEYGTAFKAGAKETDLHKDFLDKYPEKLDTLETYFGSAYPFLIDAKIHPVSGEVTPHNEIWEVFENQINGYEEQGIYDKYLNHGYGTTKLKAKHEQQELYTNMNKLIVTVTGRMIDQLQGSAEVLIGLGTIDEGYGNNDGLKINGYPITSLLQKWGYKDFEKYWKEYLEGFSHLSNDIGGVVQETSHNFDSIKGLNTAILDTIGSKDFLTSFYLDKDGNVPDIAGKRELAHMALLCHDSLSKKWRPGLNCVTRELGITGLRTFASIPELRTKKFGYRPNSSDSLENDGNSEEEFSKKYKKPLAAHLREVKKEIPQVGDVTGCCGHTKEELVGVKQGALSCTTHR